ncbi:MAG: SDR family NAD(P)-dependent oxidoreductase [Boseongicola sp.]
MKIEGQTAIVTGGASGLGAATARHLANLGANVVIFDLNEAPAQTIASEIGGLAFQVDVSSATSVADAFMALQTPPRIAVNCAGIAPAARVVGREGKLSLDTFEAVIRVNLIGAFNVLSHAAQAMTDLEPIGEERGVIINTASIAMEDGQLGQAAYSASKGGVASMSLPVARELAQHGIRVMAIAPGLFRTPMMEGLPDEVSQKIAANIPFPARLGDPGEYAKLVQQIIENPYLNGTTIRLDGAVRLPPR